MSKWRKYSFAWVTLGFLLLTFVGHWVFGWFAYMDEQAAAGAAPTTQGYLIVMLRDTFENWQSEFLQLLWQVVGLTWLLYIGSPQSKDSEDRSEAKLDAILRGIDPVRGEQVIQELERRFPSK